VIDRSADYRSDVVGPWPQLIEHHRSPIAVQPERLGREVDVDPSGDRKRDHERRRREIARARKRMDSPLEVPVA
jgi:hypothetical protein